MKSELLIKASNKKYVPHLKRYLNVKRRVVLRGESAHTYNGLSDSDQKGS